MPKAFVTLCFLWLYSGILLAAQNDLPGVIVGGQPVIFSVDSFGEVVATTENGDEIRKTGPLSHQSDPDTLDSPKRVSFSISGAEPAGPELGFFLPIPRTDPEPSAGWGVNLFRQINVFILDEGGPRVPDPKGETMTSPGWVGLTGRGQVIALKSLGNQLSVITTDQALILMPTNRASDYEFEILELPRTVTALTAHGLDDLIFMNLWDWFRWFCLLIWSLMEFLFNLTANWGITILVLAVLIKVITYPVTRYAIHHQEIAVEQQARIAPFLAEIKSKSKGIEQSKQIINLYESHHYQQGAAFKSLLGIAIQIPVLVALFNILGSISELNGVSFLWIEDLTMADRLVSTGLSVPYFGGHINALPIALGVVTFFSATFGSDGWDRSRVTNGLIMGGLFFILFYSFPSALVLYWLAANLLQLLQQLLIKIEDTH